MDESRPAIRFEQVVKEYPGGGRAVDGVTLDIRRGTFAVIVGPSGCGKTTLLKTVNRLVEPTSGRVYVEGQDVSSVEPARLRRGIGYVIQQVGLFPHMTVADNIAVVPGLLGWSKARTAARIDELLELVHLAPAQFRRRFPIQLSGGQQQRVGLARALAADPAILLMDEPFGAIDAIERAHLQDEVAALHARLRKTILFVTHDVDEALRLADLVIVMRAGRVEQSDSPLRVLARPANAFVAALVDAGDALRRLSVMGVAEAMAPLRANGSLPQAPEVRADGNLRQALSQMIASGAEVLVAVNGAGAPVGTISLDQIRVAAATAGGAR